MIGTLVDLIPPALWAITGLMLVLALMAVGLAELLVDLAPRIARTITCWRILRCMRRAAAERWYRAETLAAWQHAWHRDPLDGAR